MKKLIIGLVVIASLTLSVVPALAHAPQASGASDLITTNKVSWG